MFLYYSITQTASAVSTNFGKWEMCTAAFIPPRRNPEEKARWGAARRWGTVFSSARGWQKIHLPTTVNARLSISTTAAFAAVGLHHLLTPETGVWRWPALVNYIVADDNLRSWYLVRLYFPVLLVPPPLTLLMARRRLWESKVFCKSLNLRRKPFLAIEVSTFYYPLYAANRDNGNGGTYTNVETI